MSDSGDVGSNGLVTSSPVGFFTANIPWFSECFEDLDLEPSRTPASRNQNMIQLSSVGNSIEINDCSPANSDLSGGPFLNVPSEFGQRKPKVCEVSPDSGEFPSVYLPHSSRVLQYHSVLSEGSLRVVAMYHVWPDAGDHGHLSDGTSRHRRSSHCCEEHTSLVVAAIEAGLDSTGLIMIVSSTIISIDVSAFHTKRSCRAAPTYRVMRNTTSYYYF